MYVLFANHGLFLSGPRVLRQQIKARIVQIVIVQDLQCAEELSCCGVHWFFSCYAKVVATKLGLSESSSIAYNAYCERKVGGCASYVMGLE